MYFFNEDNSDLETLEESVKGIVKVGVVSSVNPKDGTARVYFPDRDDLVSFDLQVLQRNTLKNKDYSLPDVNERVVCLFMGDGTENGFILGAIYDRKNYPILNNSKIREVLFEDGTHISYDREKSELKIESVGDVIVSSAKAVSVSSVKSVTISSSLAIDLTAPTINLNATSINLNASGSCTGVATGTFKLSAPRIELNPAGGS